MSQLKLARRGVHKEPTVGGGVGCTGREEAGEQQRSEVRRKPS